MATIKELLNAAINTLDGLRSARAINYEKWQEDGGEGFKRQVQQLDNKEIPEQEAKVAELQKLVDEGEAN